jgi:hypothetical protein
VGRRTRAALQVGVAVALLVAVVAVVGGEPFRRALGVVTPGTTVAALGLGALATVGQALRWRAVVLARQQRTPAAASGPGVTAAGSRLTRGRSVGEYYRAQLLNAVLPGGLAGDLLRAHRAREPRRGGWVSSAAAVLVERLAGSALLLGVAAAVVAAASPAWAVGLAAAALVLAVVVVRAVGRVPAGVHAAVWGWSAVALGALVALSAVAAVAVPAADGDPRPDVRGTAVLAVLALLGMSLPVGVGGFGPREALAAVAAGTAGTTPGQAVAVTAGYGVLAALAAAPGLVLLLIDLARWSGRGRADGREVELDRDVLPEDEAPRGRP